CPPSRQRLSTRSQLAAAGVTRRGLQDAVARGELLRVRRGVYAPAPLPPRACHLLSGGIDPGYVAEVRAVLLELGPDAVAAERTAAVLWGFDLAVEPTDVELAVPLGGPRSRAGVVTTQHAHLEVCEHRVLGLDPLPLTSPTQTVLHCALSLPLQEAVVVADSALRSRRVTKRQLVQAAAALRGTPGARRVRRVLALSDPRSGSVLESLLRVLLVQAGIPRPESQYLIRDGSFLARVDFCWPQLRLVVECDGRRWHDPEDARSRDRRRDNALERLSWRVLRFTWADVLHQEQYVLHHVRECLRGWMAAA
ncbi:MAG: type IV toxin-antitoxin system AbiEi family antitoxin domain-containing protein, partial [Mycobacteriales bacterium]